MVVSQNFPCIVVMQNDLYTTDVHLGVWERRSDLSSFFFCHVIDDWLEQHVETKTLIMINCMA